MCMHVCVCVCVCGGGGGGGEERCVSVCGWRGVCVEGSVCVGRGEMCEGVWVKECVCRCVVVDING